jgi:hypothetical protein
MDVKPARIRFHIDELVVSGVAVGDRDALGEAIRSELTRLLAADALPSALTRTRRIAALDAGVVRVGSPHPQLLGTKVARAVHGSFQKQRPE